MNTFLPFKIRQRAAHASEDIQFIENRLEDYRSRLTGLAAELDALRRYHRQTLQELPHGRLLTGQGSAKFSCGTGPWSS